MLTIGPPVASPAGGSFSLDQRSPQTACEVLAGGWAAELVEGSQQMIVRGPTAVDTYLDALDEGLAAAQEALDLVVMHGGPGLVLDGADARHTLWWTEPRGLVLRVTSVSDLGVDMSVAATVRDQSGNVVPPPPPPVLAWHPSFRYFRLSQTTSDLFDAYRNMYLALEAALSTVVPQRTKPDGAPDEGEGRWLKRALQEVNNAVSLGRYAPRGSTNPVEDVFKDLYAGTRTGLFHSKSGRPVLLPHAGANRRRVIESLERLSRLYLDVSAHYLSVQRLSGVITYAGFDAMTHCAAQVLISGDDAPAHQDDTEINPMGGAQAGLTTRPAPELNVPGLKFWLGEEQVQDILPVASSVRRVALAIADAAPPCLMTVNRMDEPVSLQGVEIIQAQLGVRLVNLQQPRFRFNT